MRIWARTTSACLPLVMAVLVGCSGMDGAVSTPAGDVDPSAAAPDLEPPATPPPAPSVEPGPAPQPPPGPQPRFINDDIDVWPKWNTDGEMPDDLGPLTVTTRTLEDPRPCVELQEHLVDVDVGPGPAGAAIRAHVLERAAARQLEVDEDWHNDRECPSPNGAKSWQSTTETRCELPDGPSLRCLLLQTYGWGAGGMPVFEMIDQFTSDAATGAPLAPTDLLVFAGAGEVVADPERLEVLFLSAVCAAGGDCYELDRERRVRLERAWPRADGMVIGFPAGRVMGRPAGSQWLLIPWDWFLAAGTA